jgi:putative oxidoreductase
MPNGFQFTLLFIRVLVGLTFAAHGYYKFFMGGRIEGTARWFESIGMKPGRVHAYLAATTELTSGLLLAAGALTPLAGAGMVGVMTVAAWTVNRENGFFSANHGWEYNLVLAVIGVGMAGLGPGRYSVDRALKIIDDYMGWRGFLIALLLGLAGGIGQIVMFFRPPAKEPAPG